MASHSELIEKAVQRAMKDLERIVPKEYIKLTTDQKTKLEVAAREAAEDTYKLVKDFRPQDDVTKYLSQDKVKRTESSLEIPTFQVSFTKQRGGKHLVQFTREGKEFLPSVNPVSCSDFDWLIAQQEADIFVEVEMLAMIAAGAVLNPPVPSTNVMLKSVQQVALAIETPKNADTSTFPLRDAMREFVREWKAAANDKWKKVDAIFQLLRVIHQHDIFWEIGGQILVETDTSSQLLESLIRITVSLIAYFFIPFFLKALIALAVFKNDKLISKQVEIIESLSDTKKTL